MALEQKLITVASTAGNVVAKTQITNDGGLRLAFAHMKITTDANAGNRYPLISILDEDGSTVLGDWHAGVAITAGLTNQHMEFMPGIYRETSIINSTLQVPFPMGLWIPKNMYVQLSVENGLAGDAYTANIMLDNK